MMGIIRKVLDLNDGSLRLHNRVDGARNVKGPLGQCNSQ